MRALLAVLLLGVAVLAGAQSIQPRTLSVTPAPLATPHTPGGQGSISKHHGRKFGVLQTGELPDPLLAKYGSYGDMFRSFLQDPDPAKAAKENWVVFKAHKGDLPSAQALREFHGFLITGSPCDAFANDTWIVSLRSLIVELHTLKKRLVGVCFGHQVIAVALGGKVGRAASGDWELGLKEITANGQGILGAPGLPRTFREMESHRDEVLVPPPGALVLASSPKCSVESYQIPATDPHIFGVQFHPEFTEEYNRASIAFKKKEGWVSAQIADAATTSFDNKAGSPINPTELQTLIRKFLRA